MCCIVLIVDLMNLSDVHENVLVIVVIDAGVFFFGSILIKYYFVSTTV